MPIIGAIAGLGAIGSILLAAWRIYVIMGLLAAGFWAAIAAFAKQIFGWFVEKVMEFTSFVLKEAGVIDPTEDLVSLFQQLPTMILDLWAILGMMSNLQAIFAAYAMNMALSSLPLVGRVFRS